MSIIKDYKYILFAFLPLVLLSYITITNYLKSEEKIKKSEMVLNKLNPSKLQGKNTKQKDYELLYDRLEKKEFISKDLTEKYESYIIAFNSVERSIIALDLEIEIIDNLYKARKELDNPHLILLKKYIEASKEFKNNLIPSKLTSSIYEVLATKSFEEKIKNLYSEINKNILYLKKKNFTDIDIKELKKLAESRNEKFNRVKLLIISKLKNTINKDIIEEQTKSNTDLLIAIFTLLLLISSLILKIKDEKSKVDIKEEVENIYNFFDKKVVINNDKEAEELLAKITEEIQKLKEEKDASIEASKTKSSFLANMSHEIRTPLNGIIGFTELLKGTEINEDQKEFIDIIEKSSESLLELINNILDLSKIESDKIELENILFNPIEEFENAVEIYGPRAAEKDINIGFYIEPSLNQPIKGDPTKIKEVLINLMSNAVKFTPEKGEINIEIRKVPSVTAGTTSIKFSVKDSGVGIPKEAQASIFEAFQQASSSITREFGGTGLGLSISNKFIDLMGGKLELESEEGKGTEFSFTLDFEKDNETNPVYENKFRNTKLALMNTMDVHKTQSKYIKEYLKYYGVKVETFQTVKDLERISKQGETKLALIDTEFLTDMEIMDLKDSIANGLINIKIDFISKAKNQIRLDNLELPYEKIIYEPMNNTKIFNTIIKKLKELYNNGEELSEDKTKEELSEDKTKAIKILVAEDNIINQKLITKTLKQFGLEISIANDGLEALKMRKDNDYNLIFMDINMPNMTGVEATQEIIKWEKEYHKEHVPIIALTANAIKGDRERFMQEGMDEYTTKPLKKEEIISILNNFLGLTF